MTGIKKIEISNRDAKFKFTLRRNITVVRGNSGTGKTTLYDMVADYTRLGKASGVNISSENNCAALLDTDWKNQLQNIKDSIVFIDEGFAALQSEDFAAAAKSSGNYFVIFTREDLHELPYSVEEIYKIKTSGKYHTFENVYNIKNHICKGATLKKPEDFDILITEDSKAGFEFYLGCFSGTKTGCVSAFSNSGIFNYISQNPGKSFFVVADGAAFGSEIGRVSKLTETGARLALCVPESFEWLILNSGLVKADNWEDISKNPANYIDSQKYFSHENFYEKYLVKVTDGTPFKYTKAGLNPVYLIDKNRKTILAQILPQKTDKE